jgi:SecD/SecF fusion protein
MQGKGIVKFFLVVMALVTLVQYLFLLPTRKTERNAEEYAQSIAANYPEEEQRTVLKEARTQYLDSMSNEVVFSFPLIKDFTYQELKSRQLALGLDLKGGMSVVLQVDLREFIRTLANNSKDPTFLEALNQAGEAQKSAQSDFVTLFADAFRSVSNGEKKLSTYFAANSTLRDQINYETPDAEVISILRQKANETVELTFKRLKDRIDEFGVTQPNVSLDAARDLIIIELPGVDNPERARNFLQATAKLEFWDVYRITDQGILASFREADEKLEKLLGGDTTTVEEPNIRIDSSYTYVRDTNGTIVDSSLVLDSVDLADDPLATTNGPLTEVFNLNDVATGQLSYGQSVMGSARKNQMDKISNYLSRPEIKTLFPRDLEFRWSAKPIRADELPPGIEDVDLYELYAIKKSRGETAPLEGDRVVRATSNPDPQTGEIQVSLMMDGQGTKIWRDMTTKAAQDNNREIAIVLDNRVVSAPRVNEPIPSGNSSISGNFSVQEGQDLASILEIGKLPATPKIIQESLVGPSLGQDNINRSVQALVIGFLLVLIFMIVYYGGGGIVSIVALFLNLFFIFGALASYGTVLTLPGIAGIVLTIGMAVDANVIIFERIREELREGKSMLMAINDGFKNSYSAIIDANVTTILTAMVLAYFGLGPIKGFAVVLIIGVLSSLFTAVLVGRLIFDWWTKKDRPMTFGTKWSQNAFANLNFDWLGKRRIAYVVSGTILVLGIASFFIRGFELGVDFKGGYSYNIEFDESLAISTDELRATLTDVFEASPVVKAVNTENTFNVTTSYLINDDSDDAAERVMGKLFEGVNSLAGGTLDLENFKAPDGDGTHVTSSSKVGPTIADDITQSAFYAAIFALLLIFLYIFLRFSKWQYSLGAVAALFHDSLIVLAVFSIFHGILPFSLEIDQAFIAAILTVIGYSINDTVVVFDRIREFMNSYTNKSKEEIINMAVNSTISRTIITSLTTLFVVLILFIFGGISIKGFAFALVVGIVVGTYSSVFVATPIMSDFTGELKPKETKKKKGFSRAAKTR